MCAIGLMNAVLENVEACQHIIPGIIDLYLPQLGKAETPNLKMMLLQGLFVCMWHDLDATFTKLDAMAATEALFALFFEYVPRVNEDFEAKKFLLGLSTLTRPQELPQSL